MLTGKELQHLGRFYEVSSCTADDGGLAASGPGLVLRRTGCPDGYTEIFSLDITNGENQIELLSGETSRILVQGKKTEFSLYHVVRGEREWFLADGERLEGELVKDGEAVGAPDGVSDDVPGLSDGFLFRGLKITEYQYTEIGPSDYRPV